MSERQAPIHTYLNAFRPVLEKALQDGGPDDWSWRALEKAFAVLEAHLPHLEAYEREGLVKLFNVGRLLIPFKDMARLVCAEWPEGTEEHQHEQMQILSGLGPMGSRMILSLL